jgi:hypothetical protein
MPDSLTSFEHREDGFKFGLKGMPEVALKIAELEEDKKVVLKSASSSLDFSLTEISILSMRTKPKFSCFLMEILILLSK